MKPQDLFADFLSEFQQRRFTAGLLVAMVDLFLELDVPSLRAANFQGVLDTYPQQKTTAQGKRANTLILNAGGDRTLSLRPFYNRVERYFDEQKRFDYPSCAPHATQAWSQYERWLDALSTYTAEDLRALKGRVLDHVLEVLPSQEFDPSSVRVDPPLFRFLLEGFDLEAKKGEPTGAAYQGVVFGFLRADNPHLQVEVDKVRTGSRRRDRLGDIDAWEGQRLAITAEVKQTTLKKDDAMSLRAFASEAAKRGSIGMVVALDFDDGAREFLEEIGLRTLTIDDLTEIVGLWDPMKQRTAVASMVYYVAHVERNAPLRDRLNEFLKGRSGAVDEG